MVDKVKSKLDSQPVVNHEIIYRGGSSGPGIIEADHGSVGLEPGEALTPEEEVEVDAHRKWHQETEEGLREDGDQGDHAAEVNEILTKRNIDLKQGIIRRKRPITDKS